MQKPLGIQKCDGLFDMTVRLRCLNNRTVFPQRYYNSCACGKIQITSPAKGMNSLSKHCPCTFAHDFKPCSRPGSFTQKVTTYYLANKAGYTAIRCGRVGRGGNAHFPTFRLDGYGRTDQRTDKASYRVACPQLKSISARQVIVHLFMTTKV